MGSIRRRCRRTTREARGRQSRAQCARAPPAPEGPPPFQGLGPGCESRRRVTRSRHRQARRRVAAALTRPRLLGVSEQPLAPQLQLHLFMRNDVTRFLVRLTATHCLQDVEVVLHLVKSTVLRQSIQQRAHLVFCRQCTCAFPKLRPAYDRHESGSSNASTNLPHSRLNESEVDTPIELKSQHSGASPQ